MDKSPIDGSIRAWSHRFRRRSMLAGLLLSLAEPAAARRERPRLGDRCTIEDRCRDGSCVEGECACRPGQEACRGRCARAGTCCRRRERRCGGRCIPRKACCAAHGERSCGGRCISGHKCCTDADCDGGPDGCADGVCRIGVCGTEPLTGAPCGAGDLGICTAEGLCEQPACADPGDCPVGDAECARWACVNGRCAPDHVPQGTEVLEQRAGDCLIAVCDGGGGRAWQSHEDPPGLSSECPNPRCEDGIPRCD